MIRREIPFGRPWIGEEERRAVLEVLSGDILAHGPAAHALEEEFGRFLGEGVRCVAVSSGMAALHLAYLVLGIGPGDEVIVPAQTHVATVHAVEWVGARPVFCDCDPRTGNVSADRLEKRITPKTRAIGLVHFLGIPCDMDGILQLAQQHHLKVVEDCALAVGARWRGRHVGLRGDVGCFSFYPIKHITTAEGGMLVTRHADLAERAGKVRAFGVDRAFRERAVAGMYDVPMLGLNYRMSEIQAAIGRQQIRRLPEILQRRAENFRRLKSRLEPLGGLRILEAVDGNAVSGHYCLSVVLEGPLGRRRDLIAGRLKEAGVGTSIYYPHPVPRLSYYRNKYGYQAELFPNAEEISDRSIALPVGPHLAPEDVDYVADRMREAIAT